MAWRCLVWIEGLNAVERKTVVEKENVASSACQHFSVKARNFAAGAKLEFSGNPLQVSEMALSTFATKQPNICLN